jgi:LysR family carnitine catabolism transcriptional activator
MDVRQIEYVLAVADEGAFTRAAHAVHVAQPSLSQAVRALEAELGAELFWRLGRRVALTPAGETFVASARRVVRDMASVRAAVEAVTELRAGHLDVVSLPTLVVEPLARLIGAFRTAHPGVTVRVVEPDDAAAVPALVLDGRCEIGLAELPSAVGVEARPLGVQDLLAVCPPGTSLKGRRRLPVRRLADMALVATPAGTSTRNLVDRVLASEAIEPQIAVETEQREAILPLVLAGAGTCFLPRPLAEDAARRGAVVAELDPPLRRAIGLVHRAGVLSPAAHAFVEMLPTETPPRTSRGRTPG